MSRLKLVAGEDKGDFIVEPLNEIVNLIQEIDFRMISICQGMLDKRAFPNLSGAKKKEALSAKGKMENSWNHVSILP